MPILHKMRCPPKCDTMATFQAWHTQPPAACKDQGRKGLKSVEGMLFESHLLDKLSERYKRGRWAGSANAGFQTTQRTFLLPAWLRWADCCSRRGTAGRSSRLVQSARRAQSHSCPVDMPAPCTASPIPPANPRHSPCHHKPSLPPLLRALSRTEEEEKGRSSAPSSSLQKAKARCILAVDWVGGKGSQGLQEE